MVDVTPYPKTGPRRPPKRHATLPDAREQCRLDAHGLCEARWALDCRRWGDQAHHKARRSQGGQDVPENLAWVCTPCHNTVHANPAEAERRGLLVRNSTAVRPHVRDAP